MKYDIIVTQISGEIISCPFAILPHCYDGEDRKGGTSCDRQGEPKI